MECKVVKVVKDFRAIKGSLAYYRSAFKELLSFKKQEWAKIQCPVLVLWGEQDKALGKELSLRTADYCSQKPEILYDPGSGHFIQMDNPEWVNEKLLGFLMGGK